MIIKFKIFESIDETPDIGSWVIIEEDSETYSIEARKFINNSIGYIWKRNGSNSFIIKYYNIPADVIFYFAYSDYSDGLKIGNSLLATREEIKYCSKNKEELEHISDANKYNL